LNSSKEVYSFDTDVLVIGSGLAGLWAAIRARDFVNKVLVVDKGYAGKTSQTRYSNGQMVVMMPGEDAKAWTWDITRSQEWMARQDIVEDIFEHSYDRMEDHEKFGIRYPKDKQGNYIFQLSRGLKVVKTTPHNPNGGEELASSLMEEAMRRNVNFLNRCFIFKIIKDKNGVIGGALGCNAINAKMYLIRAKAVVDAASYCSFRGNYGGVDNVTGDGFRLAYDCGAELENMEFVVFNIGSRKYYFEGVGSAAFLGARFLNAKDESFMQKYDPLANRADTNVITRAMVSEMKEGNGPPFYYDFSTLRDKGYWDPDRFGGWMPLHLIKLKEIYHIDVLEGKNDWIPILFYVGGGVTADVNCSTNVPGLFVAGTAMSIGATLHTGWSYCRYSWSGYRAGESAGIFCKEVEGTAEIEPQEVARDFDSFKEPLNRRSDITPDSLTLELQKTLFPYNVLLVKHEHRLVAALNKVLEFENKYVPAMGASDIHELIKFHETTNMLISAEAVLRASNFRKESRAEHFREDYPSSDDNEWLKWIILSQKEGSMKLEARNIQFDKYPFAPNRPGPN
jgi:succinate dehydrogenase/fumarate reductase flavoprotein subunit